MSIFCILLAIFVLGVAGVVIFSYAFVWYENANRDPELIARRFCPGSLWLTFRLLVLETGCLLMTILVHPFGWFTPRENNKAAAAPPIILLHGLFHNRACWWWIRLRLRRRGVRACAINLPPWYDVESLTERLSRKIDELRHATGVDRVRLAGHSMGGMVARNYLQLRGGAGKVERCVLLCAPNGGSKLAPFALTRLGRNLVPGADFLRRLDEAPLPPEVRLTAISNRHDNIVVPSENTRLEGVRSLEISGMGHTSVLYHPRAVNILLDELTGESP